MSDFKPWYLSKGFIGPLITVIVIALQNMNLVALDSAEISELAFQFVALGGAALGMIGRATADKRLSKL